MCEGTKKQTDRRKWWFSWPDSRTSLRIVWSNFKCQIDNCATCWRAVNTAACRDVDLSPILKYFSVRYWPVRAIRQLPVSGDRDARKTSINSESFLRISLLNFEFGAKCIKKWNLILFGLIFYLFIAFLDYDLFLVYVINECLLNEHPLVILWLRRDWV